MPKPTNPTPPVIVNFGLWASHNEQYHRDLLAAVERGEKLSRAQWINRMVSKGLEARDNAMADEAAVNVAVAELMNALPPQPAVLFNLGDEVTIQSAIYAEKSGTVVQTASPDRNYLHPIGVELSGGRIEFFTVDGCDVTGARALYHKTTQP